MDSPYIDAVLNTGLFRFTWQDLPYPVYTCRVPRLTMDRQDDRHARCVVEWDGGKTTYDFVSVRNNLITRQWKLVQQVSVERDRVPAAITEYHDACADYEAATLAVEKAKARIEDARLALREALA